MHIRTDIDGNEHECDCSVDLDHADEDTDNLTDTVAERPDIITGISPG